MSEQYVMANARPCTVHPQHIMVNQGRREELCADLFECACGERAIGNTDEPRAHRATDVEVLPLASVGMPIHKASEFMGGIRPICGEEGYNLAEKWENVTCSSCRNQRVS